MFVDDINRLLSMEDMWKSRKPPVLLDRQHILDGTFELSQQVKRHNVSNAEQNGTSSNGATPTPTGEKRAETSQNGTQTVGGLKDQRTLSLRDNLMMFDERYGTVRHHM